MPKRKKPTCSICLDEVKSRARLPCKHVFCHKCILENQKYSNKCPNCRQQYTTYRHRKKTKHVPLSNDMKEYIASLTSRYVTDPLFRSMTNIMYRHGHPIYRIKFLIIRDTIRYLMTTDCSEQAYLHYLSHRMDEIQRINTSAAL